MMLLGKFFWRAIAAFTSAFALSALTFNVPLAHATVTFGLAVIVFVFTLRDLRWGMLFVLADLFVSGKGYWFSLPFAGGRLPLRMVLFLIVFGVWLGRFAYQHFLAHRRYSSSCSHALEHGSSRAVMAIRAGTKKWSWMLPSFLGLMILFSMLNGLSRYPFNRVFFDANAWLFFLLLPAFFSGLQRQADVQRVVTLLAAATVALSALTLATLWAFGHLPAPILEPWYRWIRNAGIGEITPVAGPLFRVFLQSHVWILVAWISVLFLLFARAFVRVSDAAAAGIMLYLSSLTLLASQSRSLWIGGTVATLLLAAYSFLRQKTVRPARAFLALALLAGTVASQFSALALISGNSQSNVAKNRFADLGTEPASSSRLNQLRPLAAAIAEHPFLGSGFGRTVTYASRDPRRLNENPSGNVTTAAFEWGYHDIGLKIGLIGLGLYVAWMAAVVRLAAFRPSSTSDGNPYAAAFSFALIGVAVANIFTPYLNHPLGIGLVLLCAAGASRNDRQITPARRR